MSRRKVPESGECPDNKVPIAEKVLLTIVEAAAYSGVGQNRIRELVAIPGCEFSLRIGSKWLVKRRKFEEWLEVQTEL